MIDNEIKVRLAAIEYLLGCAICQIYELGNVTPEHAKERHKALIENLNQAVFARTDDPAQSDHLSALVVEHVERQLVGLNTLMESRRKER